MCEFYETAMLFMHRLANIGIGLNMNRPMSSGGSIMLRIAIVIVVIAGVIWGIYLYRDYQQDRKYKEADKLEQGYGQQIGRLVAESPPDWEKLMLLVRTEKHRNTSRVILTAYDASHAIAKNAKLGDLPTILKLSNEVSAIRKPYRGDWKYSGDLSDREILCLELYDATQIPRPEFILEIANLANSHSDPLVSASALALLGKVRESLVPLLSSMDNNSRCAATVALICLGGTSSYRSRVQESLSKAVVDRRNSNAMRYSAFYAYERINSRRTIGQRLTLSGLRHFPVYDIGSHRLMSLDTYTRSIVREYSDGNSSSISPELDRLYSDLDEDPLGTSFDLMFGDRANAIGEEGVRSMRKLFRD